MFPGHHRFLITCLLIFQLTVTTEARLILEGTTEKSEEMPSCPVLADEPVGEVMERICDMCHELSSHSRPNMRIECRADCFTTDAFRECLKLFTPRRHTRHLRQKY
ncbi:hypothetical protein GCK72_014902 [Caenorhabditis remanei]|uniref:Uncharacterized protein n=1 Tax=Caenorhabditis remanei TaxID=31234 RepID=A0A6A5GUW3_CAERE|nr:hypothetical protein GCK72_014902 [Caenorhabditis remanei]KAF1758444.1 hypothetical protein GCK72_014902 [Caenorhabditis remanei]